MNMLFNAKPLAVPDPNALKSLPKHLSGPFIGMYREYQSSKDLASYSARLYNRLSTVDPETKEAVDTIKSTDPEFYATFFQGVDSDAHANGVSPLTLLELQVESRVGSKAWLKRMSAENPTDKLNEQVAMQALDLRIQYQRLIAQHQTNVLLGKLIDLEVEKTLRPPVEEFVESRLSVSNALGAAQAATAGGGGGEGAGGSGSGAGPSSH